MGEDFMDYLRPRPLCPPIPFPPPPIFPHLGKMIEADLERGGEGGGKGAGSRESLFPPTQSSSSLGSPD